ncbi:MAG: ImmA/IrrE family metallo-endopeptidase, partial [Pseudomonadota bacterium]
MLEGMRYLQRKFDRREIAFEAMAASVDARDIAGRNLESPICIYQMAEELGARVVFNDINMEGMYEKGAKPRIHLSTLRPLPRKAFNCAHELGHHFLGHGTTIDVLTEDDEWCSNKPEELAANTFAAFALMPTLGIRNAFSARGWRPETATPAQIYTIASNFGVGYSTLINHLVIGLGDISRNRGRLLLRTQPKDIRVLLLGYPSEHSLHVIDRHLNAQSVDAEIGDLLLAPKNSLIIGSAVVATGISSPGTLYRATSQGTSVLQWS